MINNNAISDRQNIKHNFEWIISYGEMLDTITDGSLSELVSLDMAQERSLSDCYNDLADLLCVKYAYKPFAKYLNICYRSFPAIVERACPLLVTDDIVELNASAAGRCAYFKNTYTDMAYSKFAQADIVSAAVYHTSFAVACEDVATGIAEYCIMPIYSSLDGDILSFYKLSDKYDLKIVHQCQLQLNDDEPVTSYALFSRQLKYDLSNSEILELTIDIPMTAKVSELLDSLSLLGATASKLNYMPTGYSSDYMRVKLTLQLSSDALSKIITYFDAVGVNYDIIGIYGMIPID